MAAVSFGSNLAALRARRALGVSTADLSATLERLASGKRINHAADDAAGLAVSCALNASARVHVQAARNVNEAISFLNVADGATSALKGILFQLRELSTQSSNGTYSDAQRGSMDKESQALQAEYGRILESTSYNGTRIFGVGDLVAQAGVGVGAALVASLSVGASTGASGSGTQQGDGTFQARRVFATGTSPYDVSIDDVNGDGKQDILTADHDSNTVSVLLGNGNGTFQARGVFGGGWAIAAVIATNFDGDAKPDIVTAAQTLNLLLGNGNGTFQKRQQWPEASPCSVFGIDLNGDGKQDLVTTTGTQADVLLGNGNGTFQAIHSFTTGLGAYFGQIADLNGDGKADIVTADNTSNTTSILLGNGNGTFQAPQAFNTGTWPGGVASADFDGDGKNDLAVKDYDRTVSVLLGNGNGTMQARHVFDAGGAGILRGMLALDLNGDAKADLVTTNSATSEARLLLGNGNGTFGAAQSLGVGANPHWIVGADLNGDGAADLVVADQGDGTVSVLLANGTSGSGSSAASVALQPITGVSLATRGDALSAQGQIDSYLDAVNQISGTIGTALSRFRIAADVASSVADVSTAAESRITDADTAENTAALLRDNILQQTSAAVLAQANQQPALALTLLHA